MPLLSEEGREMRFDERRDWDMFWLVDPLDGTRKFIKGNGEFTVNIALVLNNRPVVGVIYVPYCNKVYFCEKGHGSFMKTDPAAELTYADVFDSARALPLRKECNTPLRIAVSRSHRTPDTELHIDAMRARYPDAEVVEQGGTTKSLPDLGKFAYNKESLLNPWFECRSAAMRTTGFM